jgi:hypothetical protein
MWTKPWITLQYNGLGFSRRDNNHWKISGKVRQAMGHEIIPEKYNINNR